MYKQIKSLANIYIYQCFHLATGILRGMQAISGQATLDKGAHTLVYLETLQQLQSSEALCQQT